MRDLQTTILLNKADVEVFEFLENGARVVGFGSGVQNRKDAASQQCVEAAFALGSQLICFDLGQYLEAALRPYLGVYCFFTNSAKQRAGAFKVCLQFGNQVGVVLPQTRQYLGY